MKLQTFIDRVLEEAAGINSDANKSIVIDGEMTAESLFERVVRHVILKKVMRGDSLQDFVKTHEIQITAGVGTIPDEALKQCVDTARLRDRPFACYLPFADFDRNKFSSTGQLDYFTFNGSQILFKEAGTANFNNLPIYLTIASIPELPANLNDDLELSTEVLADAMSVMVAVLRGEFPVARLMETRNE